MRDIKVEGQSASPRADGPDPCREAEDALIEIAREQAGAMERWRLEAATAFDLFFKGEPVCPFVAPWVISRHQHRVAHAAAQAIAGALDAALDRLLADDMARALLRLPPTVELALALEPLPRPGRILGRIDGFFEPEGRFRFIEYNPYPGGLAHNLGLARAFHDAPAIAALGARLPVEVVSPGRELADAFARDAAGGRLVLGVVEAPAESGALPPEHPQSILAFARSQEIPCVRATSAQTEMVGGELHVGGRAVSHLIVDDWTFVRERGFDHPILRAIGTGAVRVLNGLVSSAVLGAKTIFAVMSDPLCSHLFDAAARAAIAEHVPWTRTIRATRTELRGEEIDLLPFVERHRELFALKPVYGVGGEGVVLGWEADEPTWKAALATLAEQGGVVQERVHTAPHRLLQVREGSLEVVSLTTDYCPFVWGSGRSVGALSRTALGGRFNISLGGVLAPVVVVGD
jgi:hypothetical protein